MTKLANQVPHFYDSASPQNIPSGVMASAYVNGYVWSQAETDRMSRVFHTSVYGESYWAKVARCIDVERGAATPADVVPFFRERAHYGHADATVYASLSNMDQIVQALQEAGWKEPRLWVADWTDNPGIRPSVRGVPAWAVQFENVGTAYDLSALFGVDDLEKP